MVKKVVVMLFLCSFLFGDVFFPFLSIGSFSPAVPSSSSSVLTCPLVGDNFTYLVNRSFLYFKIGRSELNVNDRYQFQGLSQSLSTPIILTVVNTTDFLFNYSLSCNFTKQFFSVPNHELVPCIFLASLSNLPFNLLQQAYYEYMEGSPLNSGSLSSGIPIDDRFIFVFPSNESIWNSFLNYYNNFSSSINTNENYCFKFSSLINDSSLMLFEVFIRKPIVYDTIKMSINTGFMFAINKTTGVLLGLRVKGAVSGKEAGTRMKGEVDFVLLQGAFSLPELSLYEENQFVGFAEGAFLLLPLGSFSLILLVIRRKKLPSR